MLIHERMTSEKGNRSTEEQNYTFL